jgi:hypothetical protein
MLSVNVMHVEMLLSVRSARLGLLPPTGMDTALFAAAFVSAHAQKGGWGQAVRPYATQAAYTCRAALNVLPQCCR